MVLPWRRRVLKRSSWSSVTGAVCARRQTRILASTPMSAAQRYSSCLGGTGCSRNLGLARAGLARNEAGLTISPTISTHWWSVLMMQCTAVSNSKQHSVGAMPASYSWNSVVSCPQPILLKAHSTQVGECVTFHSRSTKYNHHYFTIYRWRRISSLLEKQIIALNTP